MQTWKDVKGYILKKEAERRNYIQGTGGGPPPKIAFSNFEENVLQLLTLEAAGLENIPEGGITNKIPNINYDIEQINNTEINQNITETENMEIGHVSGNEQNLEMTNLAGKIRERKITENISPNYTSTSIRNTRKSNS